MLRTNERWIPSYEGHYSVTDQGEVFSYKRNKVRPISTASVNRCGHKNFLACMPGQKDKHILVHRAVMSAFVGECPEGMVACHNNGDAQDNRLENLRWDTISKNSLDATRHGTHPGYKNRGELSTGALLSNNEAAAIFAEWMTGKYERYADLDAVLGTRRRVYVICSHKSKMWRWLRCCDIQLKEK